MRNLAYSLTMFVALCMVVGGCTVAVTAGNGGGPTPSGSTRVRVVHAATELLAFDVCIDDEVVVENARYGEVTEYGDVPSGDVTFSAIDAGGECDDRQGLEGEFDLNRGEAYTFLVISEEDQPLQVTDNMDPLELDRARVRLINASPDSLVIAVEDRGGLELLEGVRFGVAADYERNVTVVAGDYDLLIQVTPALGDQVTEELDATLERGHVYTIFAFGEVEGDAEAKPFEVRLVDDGFVGFE